MKKILFVLVAFVCVSTQILAQDLNYRYEIEDVQGIVAAKGSVMIRVWSYENGRKLEKVLRNKHCQQAAIEGLLFKGYSSSDARTSGKKALVPEGRESHAKYFDEFFETGAYMQFVSLTNNGEPEPGSEIQISKKEWKIGLIAVVNFDALRQRLEQDGIIPKLVVENIKKPIIMVVPSDNWCNANGYMARHDNNGKTDYEPLYEKAIVENTDLKSVLVQINSMMADRDYPAKDLEQALKSLRSDAAEDLLATSKTGAEISETPIDKINKVAKNDIVIEVTWKVNQVGPKRSVTYTLAAKDAYTGKQIAATTGTGNPSYTAETAQLLKEAIVNRMDEFNDQLMSYFTDLSKNGREVILRLRVWDDSENDFESEFDNQELSEIIENWVSDNTVKNSFSLTTSTENLMLFEQTRISLQNEKGRPQDTRAWARGLMKHLKDLGVESKLSLQGLGKATITIGGK